MQDWVSIIEAGRAIGRPPQTIRYWLDSGKLKGKPFTPEIGHTTTLVNMSDVKRLDETSKSRRGQ